MEDGMLPTTADGAALYPQRRVTDSPIRVERWHSEIPLVVVVGLFSALMWLVAVISIIGIIYAVLIGLFFFIGHVVFVAHVRGSAVRLGPSQFPEMYADVERLARRMGMSSVPETYLMQSGGTLNAFAAKFLRSNIVVLFSDLIDACGDNTAARDMIIGHELGHIHAGHLSFAWFLLPGSIVPFLGTALSRAREYTCDRYGLAAAGEREGGLAGLTILAAGAKHGPLVNRDAMVRQSEQMNTGWMRIGEWLSTHPPLASRLAALDPSLQAAAITSGAGTLRAMGIIGTVCIVPVVGVMFAAALLVGAATMLGEPPAGQTAASFAGPPAVPPEQTEQTEPANLEIAKIQAEIGLGTLAGVLDTARAKGALPADVDALYEQSAARFPGDSEPRDPFGGERFLYEADGSDYILRSVGPDLKSGTADDIIKQSRQ
jgi:Zn-dependent protease with chaperone function